MRKNKNQHAQIHENARKLRIRRELKDLVKENCKQLGVFFLITFFLIFYTSGKLTANENNKILISKCADNKNKT